eukprot:5846958-Pleurochrysis_carterae.AAC.2
MVPRRFAHFGRHRARTPFSAHSQAGCSRLAPTRPSCCAAGTRAPLRTGRKTSSRRMRSKSARRRRPLQWIRT